MAQNVTVAGASYSDVPSVVLPKTGGGSATFVDTSDTTATADDVASGKVFYAASGARTTGTNSGGGGESPFTLIASETFQLSYSSTTAENEDHTFRGLSEYFPGGQTAPFYVRLRDENGSRSGYYYGFDALCLPRNTTQDALVQSVYRYDDGGAQKIYTPTSTISPTGYGIWIRTVPVVSSSGILTISLGKRYNATNSYTINGTFTLEVYLIELPE